VNLTKEKLMSTLKATFGGVVVLIATLAMIAFAQALPNRVL